MARIKLLNLAAALLLISLSACSVGPDYVKPKTDTPASFREADGWKKAEPQDHVPRGTWWTVFNDTQLNGLEEQVNITNQNIKAAEAQFRQALAVVQAARAAYYPTLTAGPTVSRYHQSAVAPGAVGSALSTSGISLNNSDFISEVTLSWQLDLWGKVRRQVESSKASAQASAADLEGVRLSAQATLAQDYFQLRSLDSQTKVLGATVEAYRKFLELTKNRYATGVAAQSDVQTALTQLETTEAQFIALGVQRTQMEHAIAILMGKAPSELSIPPSPLDAPPPVVPACLPSELLERRPDIASAERQAAAANAQIGVAIAAYYPTITIGATGGLEASTVAQWFTWPARFWTLGPGVLQQTLFDGGLRGAQTEEARAAYDASAATYRQTVLTAFQQVEDNLSALRILEQQAQAQDVAVNSSIKNLDITINHYKAGTASALDVINTQTTLLSNQLTAVGILGSRMNASVLLIDALGGGWNTADLPSDCYVGQRHYKGYFDILDPP
jgi:NodT family efflux transporter outer membrane factor (OMF) lipoprotein